MMSKLQPLALHIEFGDVGDDPRGQTRTVPMKVLCLGMGRNGTESLCVALNKLGIPTYHGWHTVANPKHNTLWYEAMLSKYHNRGKPWTRADFDQMLGRSGACADNPAAMFASELIEAYPEAKIILNSRSVDEWWTSWERNVLPLVESRWLYFLGHWDWEAYQFFVRWRRMIKMYFRQNLRRNAKRVYEDHNALIRGLVPSERLLEWTPGDGWEPICKFLDVPVPEEEFPWRNSKAAFDASVEFYMAPRLRRAKRNLIISATVVVSIAGGMLWTNMNRWSVLTSSFG